MDRRCVGFGQFGQLEIVGGEEAEGFVFLQQVFGDGVREGEAVEGGGAASDFVHEDEGLVGGVVEDVGGFAHFDHEGGAVGGEVVGGAMRVKIWSMGPIWAASAGTKLPVCAMRTMWATWRM